MATMSLRLCSGCKEVALVSLTGSDDSMSRLFTVNITLPPDVGADILGRLARILCSHCKGDLGGDGTQVLGQRLTLSTTKRSLLDVEEEIIGLRLREAKQELSAVEALILATGDQLKLLKDTKEDILGRISQFRQLLSPARRLPKEVVVEIARLAQGESLGIDSLDAGSGVWPLTQVCCSWRSAILNAPLLWSTVNIGSWHARYRYAAAVLHESIKRSQYVSLDIAFVSSESELSKLLFQIICSQSDRWRSLELRIHPSHLASLDQIRNTLTRLRSLKVYVKHTQTRFDTNCRDDFFAFAPNLQTVDFGWQSLLNPVYAPLPIIFKLPSETITSFALWVSDTLYHRLPDAIPQSATNLLIGAGTTNAPESIALVPAPYPSITHLRVCKAAWLLDAFTCMGLEVLQVSTLRLDEEFLNPVRSFIHRSVHDQNQFCLVLSSVTSPSINLARKLYRTFHFLTQLELYGNAQSDQGDMTRLLNPLMLSPAGQSQNCLPALQSLVLHFGTFRPRKSLYVLIHSVVASRVNPPTNYAGAKLATFIFTDPLSLVNGQRISLKEFGRLLERATNSSH